MVMSQLLSQPAVKVAPQLLGWHLVHQTPAGTISGRIVETEAYMGSDDPASHGFRGPTKRNAVMFGPAGHAYIYFTYGMHYCFNVVTGRAGEASAVLIRALEPLAGIELMEQNRGSSDRRNLTSGPAKLVQAFGITKSLYGHDLSQPPLLLLPGDPDGEIAVSPRIGIKNGTEHLWRFFIKGNTYVSRN